MATARKKSHTRVKKTGGRAVRHVVKRKTTKRKVSLAPPRRGWQPTSAWC